MKQIIEKLKAAIKSLSLKDEDRSALETQLAEIEAAAATAPTPSPTKPAALDEATRQLIESLQGQVKSLTDALNAETQERKRQAEAMRARAEAEQKKKIEDYIKKVTEGSDARLTPAEMNDKWKGLLEANFEATSKIIDEMPVNPAIAKGAPQKQQPRENKSGDAPRAGTREEYLANRDALIEAAKSQFATAN